MTHPQFSQFEHEEMLRYIMDDEGDGKRPGLLTDVWSSCAINGSISDRPPPPGAPPIGPTPRAVAILTVKGLHEEKGRKRSEKRD